MPHTMKLRRPLARNCWNSGVSQHEKSSFSSQRVGGMTFISASLSTGIVAPSPCGYCSLAHTGSFKLADISTIATQLRTAEPSTADGIALASLIWQSIITRHVSAGSSTSDDEVTRRFYTEWR